MNIYQEELMDHYEHPRNWGEVEKPDLEMEEMNASCGDMIQLSVKIDDGKLEEVKWIGKGCAVSMAAMSKMSEWLRGKNWEEVKRMNEERLLKEAIGWEVNPGRRKCLELAVKVVKNLASSIE